MTLKSISSKSKKESFSRKIKALRSFFFNWGVDGCMIENTQDLYYLTGLDLSLGRLLISQKEDVLLVDGRYFEACREEDITSVQPLSEENARLFFTKHHVHRVALDAGKTTVYDFEKMKKAFSMEFVLQPSLLQNIRAIKDFHEINILQKAAEINWKGFLHVSSLIQEGIMEKELAWAFESYVRTHGADGISFTPIVAFGANSAKPHHRSTTTKLKKGDLVLLDLGSTFQKYQSDLTRVLFFGDVPSKLQEMYELVKKAQKKSLALCKENVAVGQLDAAAREVFRKEKMEDKFLHSLGHGIGIEIHEFPRIRETGENKDVLLQEGMVITIEPGLYLPGLGGVRYEDTIRITKSGYENFYSQEE